MEENAGNSEGGEEEGLGKKRPLRSVALPPALRK
jgi:hypothetical protein